MNDWRATFALVESRYTDEDAEDELRARVMDWAELEVEPANITWEVAPDDDVLSSHLGPRLSVEGDDVCHLGFYESTSDGTHYTAIRAMPTAEQLAPYRRRVELSDRALAAFENFVDFGASAHGFHTLSYYIHGADLRALRGELTLSWPLACLLHGAITEPLRELHGRGYVHGALTPARIRLTLLREPNTRIEEIPPIRLIAPRFDPITPDGYLADLRAVAEAVFEITAIPDAQLAEILADQGGRDVARDLLLERGARVESLLADLVGGDLATLHDYQDVDPEELATLWATVSTLDPLITAGV